MRGIASTLLALPVGRALSSIRFSGRNATKAGLATNKTKATAIPMTTISGSFAEARFTGRCSSEPEFVLSSGNP
jgi:hypothetical protein